MAPKTFRLTETQQATLRTLLRVAYEQSRNPIEAFTVLVDGADFDRTERETFLRWCQKGSEKT